VKRAHREFIAPGKYEFRPRADAVQLGDVVRFRWYLVAVSDGQTQGTGLEFLVLDPDGLIRADYQFIES
jgi:hypothetical protein